MIRANNAREAARRLLETELPRRWAHTQGVAGRARDLALVLGEDAELIEASAWLHDIGYASAVASTGLHSLDGARYLRDVLHAPDVLCRLVAHHTSAMVEAEERGMPAIAPEFASPSPELLDALTYCDLTAGVDGSATDVDDRLAEILTRYPEDHVVHRSITRSAPGLKRAARNMEDRLTRASGPASLARLNAALRDAGTSSMPRGAGRRPAQSKYGEVGWAR